MKDELSKAAQQDEQRDEPDQRHPMGHPCEKAAMDKNERDEHRRNEK